MSWIAIDGGAGSGESVLGFWLVNQLKYLYLDPGLFYRAFTWMCLQLKRKAGDQDQINHLLKRFRVCFLPAHRIKINDYIINQGVLYETKIRQQSAILSQLSLVRLQLTRYFDRLVANHNYVAVGRDIANHALPQAQVKIFITASSKVQAQRRLVQIQHQMTHVNNQQLLNSIKERDYQDTYRSLAPFKTTPW